MVNQIGLLYFSPTHTTQKILQAIASAYPESSKLEIDITRENASSPDLSGLDLLIVGIPVYAGRLPETAATRLQTLKGLGLPVVAVVVYGNRAYEDALLELKDLLEKGGLKVFAAAAFIGEHSFSTTSRPIAPGRPDSQDLAQAKEFGIQIQRLHSALSTSSTQPALPGHFPYKARKPSSCIIPDLDKKLCGLCLECVSLCPVQAISLQGQELITDPNLCIRCAACVKGCPHQARQFLHPSMIQLMEMLHSNCSSRKEPELFL